MNDYVIQIDSLKGLSIIAVVLYHMGLLSTGYLAVDIFFVINGFFVIPKVVDIDRGGYSVFLSRRFFRLWPMVLLVSLVCLIVGYVGMLPDDYENLCQSIVATSFFSNNILQAITTKNYWDVVNDYKPLMHTWYLGILASFYVVFPLILMLTRKLCISCSFSYTKIVLPVICLFCVLSFSLYLMPNISSSDKFYHLPFRLFEILSGGIIALIMKGGKYHLIKSKGDLADLVLFLLFVCIGSGWVVDSTNVIMRMTILVIVVILTCMFLFLCSFEGIICKRVMSAKLLAILGKMSLSIYLWHQVVLAFYRYFVGKNVSAVFFVIIWIIVIFISIVTYRLIEQGIRMKSIGVLKMLLAIILVTTPAIIIYARAGVVRDVPELDVYMNDVHRGMFGEYTDRIFNYDKDFIKNNKINVLIVGNSFARDWANVILESTWRDSVSISYIFDKDSNYISKIKSRIKNSDVVFVYLSKRLVPSEVWLGKKEGVNVWGIGVKSYGESNGVVYAKRFNQDYYHTTVEPERGIEELNRALREEWGERYIDFMSYVRGNDGRIKVFTPDHKFISMDCRHLTPEGCRYYANMMDLKVFIKKAKAKK